MAIKPKKVKLPSKLSGLLHLAVKDCKKAQKSKKYKLDMLVLHEPSNKKGKCKVCMAGAILAFTVKIPISYWIISFSEVEESSKIRAVDLARTGQLDAALNILGLCNYELAEQSEVIVRQSHAIQMVIGRRRHRASFNLYEKVADELEAVGL